MLVGTTNSAYDNINRVQGPKIWKDGISSVCNFQLHLLFALRGNPRCNSGTQLSPVTFRTVSRSVSF